MKAKTPEDFKSSFHPIFLEGAIACRVIEYTVMLLVLLAMVMVVMVCQCTRIGELGVQMQLHS